MFASTCDKRSNKAGNRNRQDSSHNYSSACLALLRRMMAYRFNVVSIRIGQECAEVVLMVNRAWSERAGTTARQVRVRINSGLSLN